MILQPTHVTYVHIMVLLIWRHLKTEFHFSDVHEMMNAIWP